MKLTFLKKTRNELKIEVEGEGHTFCNLLQYVLIGDKNVEMAGYDLPHPLIPKPVVYIRTKRDKDAGKSLKRALEQIREMTVEFRERFEAARIGSNPT